MDLEFVLEPLGEVPVRVLDADGRPAKKLLVTAVRDVYVGGGAKPQKLDAEGRVVLSRCAPGMHRLLGLAEGVMLDRPPIPFVFDEPLRIVPGRNPEVVVQLPASPDVTGR